MKQTSWKSVFLGILTIVIIMSILAVGYGLLTVYVFDWYSNSQWYEVAFIVCYIQLALFFLVVGAYTIAAYVVVDRAGS